MNLVWDMLKARTVRDVWWTDITMNHKWSDARDQRSKFGDIQHVDNA